MKKTLIMLAIATMTLGMASCEKDNYKDAKDLHFTAILEGSEKTSLGTDGETLTWNSSGETIKVSNTLGGTVYTATYSATPGDNARIADFSYVTGSGTLATGEGVSSYRAFYPANITTDGVTITLPKVQQSTNGELAGFPMYTESNNETFYFKNLCAVLKLTLTKSGERVKKIQIVTDKTVNGTFTVNYNSGDPTLTPSTDAAHQDHTKIITMELANAVSITSGATFNIYIPRQTYNYMQINVYDANGLLFTKSTHTATTFNRSRYKTLTFTSDEITFNPYTSNGKYTKNNNGDQVFFACSNLIRNSDGDPGEYILSRNIGYYSTNYNTGIVSLFNFNVASQGSYNITNAGGTTAGWYNMTSGEWNYVLNQRTMTMGFEYKWSLFQVEYSFINANGSLVNSASKGVVLFPDDFVWPLDNSKKPVRFGSYTGSDWCGVTINRSEWEVLQDAGCVFLPWTGWIGYANNPTHSMSNAPGTSSSRGCYWTSSEGDQNGAYGDSYYTYFTPRYMYFTGEQHADPGNLYAIRLVKDVN